MRLVLTGRQVEVTPDIRRMVEKKAARLARVLGARAVSGQVELRLEKYRHVVELHVHVRGGHILKGRAVATSWDEAAALAVDRLVQQGQRLKGKWQERKRLATPIKRATAEPPDRTVDVRRIVRARRYPVRTMTLDEAARIIGPNPDAFVVFRNADSDALSVMFRRKDGDIGLIEPEP
ncbi:MAG TPA: ribosome-associated translation inhibitor RaiA [Vicinamibacterales bacterium]|nr:ribosome-associated translation inhibitor RaiA [Vicinamibacterales bacterium]HPK71881.1 ribosome-associated translation inhibitor RaiA [Vicinamibacterales bacterium]